ncbi:Helix-turn-helix domain-containing protein [Gracilibacillus orientalis]|uniref:Helix-turn-helix domain-containing protein n=1 Tax=Gracilibacillus orientalis TaxID=334253 RepID=A0A1I4GX58_9BACI|nr:helix-turn-helix transcriptional regulator [Gracilibacillus orientalis]SFL34120.1 Helix-turn-helix domain-containing protein [Gracilibacillus orientalis]
MNELEKDNFLYVLGEYYKKQRITIGWTQSEVAETLHMSVRSIQQFEKGELNLAISRFVELTELLNVPYSFVEEQFKAYGYQSFQEQVKEVTNRKEKKKR